MPKEIDFKTPQQCKVIGTIGSIARKSEIESIVDNILTILIRTGNTFRPVRLEEYIAEREKDGDKVSSSEEFWFNKFYSSYSPLSIRFHPDWQPKRKTK